jgi:hypothetical protein
MLYNKAQRYVSCAVSFTKFFVALKELQGENVQVQYGKERHQSDVDFPQNLSGFDLVVLRYGRINVREFLLAAAMLNILNNVTLIRFCVGEICHGEKVE